MPRTCPRCGKTAAAIYARISDDQKGERLGVTDQIDDCRARCEDEGWCTCPEAVFSDNDIGALYRKARPGYEALIAGIKAGRFSVLVARDDGRLTRNTRQSEELVDLIEDVGVEVHTLWTERWNLATAAGRKKVRDTFSDQRYEAERTGERVARARLRNARKGLPSPGGNRAWGFKSNGIDHEPEEAEQIRDVASRLLAGESLRSAALHYGKVPKDVRRVLLSARTVGVREYRPKVKKGQPVVVHTFDGAWEPILDRQVWEAVGSMLKSRSRDKVAGVAARKYLLTGLLFCGAARPDGTPCGSRLFGRRQSDGTLRYACHPGGCVTRSMIPLDNLIRDVVLAKADMPVTRAEIDPALPAAVVNYKEKIRQAEELFDEGVWSKEKYVTKLVAYEEQLLVAEGRLSDAVTASEPVSYESLIQTGPDEYEAVILPDDEEAETARRLAQWEASDLRQRRLLIDHYVERITVNRVLRRQEGDPEPVVIHWRGGAAEE